MKGVIIYTSNACSYCIVAKKYFDGQGIKYEERNVTKEKYMKELVRMGYMTVPVIKIGEEIIVGFDAARIEEILKNEEA